MESPPTGSRPSLWLIPALLYVGAVFYLGTLPQGPDVPSFPMSDKAEHLIVFGGMSVVLWGALRGQWPRLGHGRQLGLAAVVSSLLGAMLELCQHYVPNRSMDFFDWVADTIGIGLATGLGYLIVLRFLGGRVSGGTTAGRADVSKPS